jgi:hypothetical protein
MKPPQKKKEKKNRNKSQCNFYKQLLWEKWPNVAIFEGENNIKLSDFRQLVSVVQDS